MTHNLEYKLVKPSSQLADFVYCFSSLQNLATITEAIIIPNGKIDLFFTLNTEKQFRISLVGLETKPKPIENNEITKFFSVSFNPIAIEYVFNCSIADIIDSGKILPNDFWDFKSSDMDDFEFFCDKISAKIQSLIPKEIDERKQNLFELIFATNGEIGIQELAEKVFWSSRQINRYFNQQFGLSLKSYCNILRFQASLPFINEGTLHPQLNFTDQSHYIKEIKKLSGVSPKELFKNKNDRFLQFLTFDSK